MSSKVFWRQKTKKHLHTLLLAILILLLIVIAFKAYSLVRNNADKNSLAKEARISQLPGKVMVKNYYHECHDTSAAFAPGPTVCSKNVQVIYRNGANHCGDYRTMSSAISSAGYNLSEQTKLRLKNYASKENADCQTLDLMSMSHNDITYISPSDPPIFVTCKYGTVISYYDLDNAWPGSKNLKFDRAKIYGCIFSKFER